jgi:hypothetical protein
VRRYKKSEVSSGCVYCGSVVVLTVHTIDRYAWHAVPPGWLAAITDHDPEPVFCCPRCLRSESKLPPKTKAQLLGPSRLKDGAP